MPNSKKKTTKVQHAKDFGFQLLNRTGNLLGLWSNFYQDGALSALTPEEQARRVEDHNLSLGLDNTLLPGMAAKFDAYMAGRIKDISSFDTIKLGGKSIGDTLNSTETELKTAQAAFDKASHPGGAGAIDRGQVDATQAALTAATVKNDAAKQVKALLNKEFETPPAKAFEIKDGKRVIPENSFKTGNIADRQQIMTEHMRLLQEALSNTKALFRPGNVIEHLSKLNIYAIKEIQAQQEKEKKAIHALFQPTTVAGAAGAADTTVDSDFVKALKSSHGLNDQDTDKNNKQVDQLKTSMLSTLEAAQKKELEEYEKDTNDTINKFHAAAKKEDARVSYLSTLYYNNETMRKIIRDLYEHNRGAPEGTVLMNFDNEDPCAIFKNIDIKKLGILETITGRPLTIGADGSLSMKLPNRLLSYNYYRSSHNNVLADMRGITDAMRASGAETIIVDLGHYSQEHAEALARVAYEASRESGYEDGQATFNVNGKAMTSAELFKNRPSEKSAIDAKADRNKSVREQALAKPTLKDYKEFTEKLRAGDFTPGAAGDKEEPMVPPAPGIAAA